MSVCTQLRGFTVTIGERVCVCVYIYIYILKMNPKIDGIVGPW